METLKFNRGKTPEGALRIGKRAEIDKWFKEWARYNLYEVDDNFNITVLSFLYLAKTSVSHMPDNLTINGNVLLGYTQITSLPDNLTVKGDLFLRNTPITNLPDNLKVIGEIYKDF